MDVRKIIVICVVFFLVSGAVRAYLSFGSSPYDGLVVNSSVDAYVRWKALDRYNYDVAGADARIDFPRDALYEIALVNASSGIISGPYVVGVFAQGRSSEMYNLTNTPVDDTFFCNPLDSRFGCKLESVQAMQILLYAKAYSLNRTLQFRNITLNLVTADINNDADKAEDEIIDTLCNHYIDRYDCGQSSNHGYDTKGALRQGQIIYAYAEAAHYGFDVDQVLLNYTYGSAAECDVWSGDFDCDIDEGMVEQAWMILGYSMAYARYRNDTYYGIVRMLADGLDVQTDEPVVAVALWNAGLSTGSPDYLRAAENMTVRLNAKCEDGCSLEDYSMTLWMLVEAYKNTDNYTYLAWARSLVMNGTGQQCDPYKGSFVCPDAYKQGMLGYVLWLYQEVEHEDRRLYNVHLNGGPRRGENLTISFSLEGEENATLHVAKVGMDYETIESQGKEFYLNDSVLSHFGVYEYYVTSGDMRFPAGNGTEKIVVSARDEMLKSKAKNLFADPIRFCDAFDHTDAGRADYSCYLEYMQGDMLEASLAGEYAGFNVSNGIIYNLSVDRIDPTENPTRHQTCDHTRDDYDCEKNNPYYPASMLEQAGVVRQSSMIQALWEAYGMLGDGEVERIARSYTEGHPEACDVWSFGCDSPLMGLAMAEAYRHSGEISYLNNMISVADLGMGLNDSAVLGTELFTAYALTGNVSYLVRAVNISDNLLEDCLKVGQCGLQDYAEQITLFLEAFRQTNNPDYLRFAYKKLMTKPDSGVEYCNPLSSNIRCNYPSTQGMLASTMSDAYMTYYNVFTENLSLGIDSVPSVSMGDIFNVTCTVHNKDLSTARDISVQLHTDMDGLGVDLEGYEVTPLQGVIDQIAPNSTTNVTWTVNATKGGRQEIECVAGPEVALVVTEVHGIGDIVSVSTLRNPQLIMKDSLTYINYTVVNDRDFILSNVTVNMTFPDAVAFSQLTFTDKNARYVSEGFTGFKYDQLSIGESVTYQFAIRMNGIEGMYPLNFSILSDYEGKSSFVHVLRVINGSITIDASMPSTVTLMRRFNLTVNVSNYFDEPLHNLTLNLSSFLELNESSMDEAFSVLAVTNRSMDVIDNSSYFVPELVNRASVILMLEPHAMEDGVFRANLVSGEGIDMEATKGYMYSRDGFGVKYSKSGNMKTGSVSYLMFNVSNNVSHTLHNITLTLTIPLNVSSLNFMGRWNCSENLTCMGVAYGVNDSVWELTMNITNMTVDDWLGIRLGVSGEAGEHLLQLSVSSIENMSTNRNYTVRFLKQRSSGGGGGSSSMIVPVYHLDYKFVPNSIYQVIKKTPTIHEMLGFNNMTYTEFLNSSLLQRINRTMSCMNVSRSVGVNDSTLNYSKLCDLPGRVMMIDVIDKSTFDSIDDFHVGGYNYDIIEADPVLAVDLTYDDKGYLWYYDYDKRGLDVGSFNVPVLVYLEENGSLEELANTTYYEYESANGYSMTAWVEASTDLYSIAALHCTFNVTKVGNLSDFVFINRIDPDLPKIQQQIEGYVYRTVHDEVRFEANHTGSLDWVVYVNETRLGVHEVMCHVRVNRTVGVVNGTNRSVMGKVEEYLASTNFSTEMGSLFSITCDEPRGYLYIPYKQTCVVRKLKDVQVESVRYVIQPDKGVRILRTVVDGKVNGLRGVLPSWNENISVEIWAMNSVNKSSIMYEITTPYTEDRTVTVIMEKGYQMFFIWLAWIVPSLLVLAFFVRYLWGRYWFWLHLYLIRKGIRTSKRIYWLRMMLLVGWAKFVVGVRAVMLKIYMFDGTQKKVYSDFYLTMLNAARFVKQNQLESAYLSYMKGRKLAQFLSKHGFPPEYASHKEALDAYANFVVATFGEVKVSEQLFAGLLKLGRAYDHLLTTYDEEVRTIKPWAKLIDKRNELKGIKEHVYRDLVDRYVRPYHPIFTVIKTKKNLLVMFKNAVADYRQDVHEQAELKRLSEQLGHLGSGDNNACIVRDRALLKLGVDSAEWVMCPLLVNSAYVHWVKSTGQKIFKSLLLVRMFRQLKLYKEASELIEIDRAMLCAVAESGGAHLLSFDELVRELQ